MKLDLTATNKNTLYVVYDYKKNIVVFETESKQTAISMVNNTANLDYSTYEPFTYAKNKKDLAELYETTFFEY